MSEAVSSIALLDNIRFCYRKEKWILDGVSLTIPRGGITMMIGASGTGKTTVLKILAGLVHPEHGQIIFEDNPVKGHFTTGLRRQIGYIPQHLGLVRNLSVLENVLMGSFVRHNGLGPFLGFFPGQEIHHAMAILSQLKIPQKACEKVFHLSGGERQRVAIARTMLQRPKLILADEFVSDLDLKTATEVLALAKDMAAREGATFLMSMHDLQLVKTFAEHVLLMEDGKITLISKDAMANV